MLQVNNLTFFYDPRKSKETVFRNVSIEFRKGFNVILGPNGAGKSTLLKCIFGLLKGSGEIKYENQNIYQLSKKELTSIMAYLPQMESNNSTLKVLEMVLLGRLSELRSKIKDEDLNIAMHALKMLNIENLAMRMMSELSGGQQKLVSIAQTLVRAPKIILMDEPTNFLDLQKQLEICQLLREIMILNKVDLILTLHDINLAARYGTHIFVLDKVGRLYSWGTPKEVITETMLYEVYGVEANITLDAKGIPVVSPIRSVREVYVSI